MKTLFLCRHAHAGESDRGDFYRELSHDGKKEARRLAIRLAETACGADLIVSSPAARALQTAQIIARKIGYDVNRILTDITIYEQNLSEILALLHRLTVTEKNVWLFGHNPSVQELVARFTASPPVKTPPGTITAIEFDATDWPAAFSSAGKGAWREIP